MNEKILKKLLAISLAIGVAFGPISVFANEPNITAPEAPSAPSSPYESSKIEQEGTLPEPEQVQAPVEKPVEEPLAVDPVEMSEAAQDQLQKENPIEQVTPVNNQSGAGTQVENKADLKNNVGETVNTGQNHTDKNTGNGEVKTGNANAVLGLINLLNTNFISGAGGKIIFFFKNIYNSFFGNLILDPTSGEYYNLNGARVTIENSNTGANSENNAGLTVEGSDNTKISNNGKLENSLKLSANSGENTAEKNTGSGKITTGNASVALNLLNFINTNIVATEGGIVGFLNLFGDFFGDLVVPIQGVGTAPSTITVQNQNTGADSVNNAGGGIENKSSLILDNDGNLVNQINTNANTGGNSAEKNTLAGTIKTGLSNTLTNIKNFVNTSIVSDTAYFVLVNVLGKWEGVSALPFEYLYKNLSGEGLSFLISNFGTGAGSQNNAELNVENKSELDLLNSGEVNNRIDLSANTGGNSASMNTGSGSVSTGDAGIIGNILNMINTNVIGKKVVFLVVNIFGDWFGNLTTKNSASVPKVTPVQIPVGIAVSNMTNNFQNIVKGMESIADNPIEGMSAKNPVQLVGVKGVSEVLADEADELHPDYTLRYIFVALFILYSSVVLAYLRLKTKERQVK